MSQNQKGSHASGCSSERAPRQKQWTRKDELMPWRKYQTHDRQPISKGETRITFVSLHNHNHTMRAYDTDLWEPNIE